ncbi:hypothetical protein BC939DRAFT_259457 [Gamsiella multidivaricata]|uniref:uncharacterized protein n=1 Tax=Gamsiella multidivaricata TaxID=101098 RepID=UPI00221F8781|nr:uncharacterized protein BC939DRAFT_259457 [Gamsiella multidivaricata]KAI7830718.1 hypothetical protein BC939DRAFT_259457 [Gamsiella multidivaricata]
MPTFGGLSLCYRNLFLLQSQVSAITAHIFPPEYAKKEEQRQDNSMAVKCTNIYYAYCTKQIRRTHCVIARETLYSFLSPDNISFTESPSSKRLPLAVNLASVS